MKKHRIVMDNPFDQMVADTACELYEPGGRYPPTKTVRDIVGGQMNPVAAALGVWRRRTIALEELADYINALESNIQERGERSVRRPFWMRDI